MLVHRSNSLEELVDRMSEVLAQPLQGWMSEEKILIQSAGMERYLSRELSKRAGILAGAAFPFPRAFLRDLLDRALGKDAQSEFFERQTMAWVLYDELLRFIDQPHFEAVKAHLIDDVDGSRRFFLAETLAHLFDQYLTYRHRMVLDWQEGKDVENFQAILWRRLIERLGNAHFTARCQRLLFELNDKELRAALPERICLMGGPGLPPLFLQLFARLSEVIPVHVFAFTVSQEYFADASAFDLQFVDPEFMDAKQIHPLLASMGQVGADFQKLLEETPNYADGSAQFRISEAQTNLGQLQRHLIGGDTLRQLNEAEAPLAEPVDDSISIDSCHSRLREVEVLHDRLLSWFSEDESLRAEDIVVLAPDIEVYSPLVEAVFSARAGESPHIPFRIADRSERHTNPAARALILALSILRGRLKASEVLDLLQLEPVRDRYQIDAEALSRVSSWVSEANIRWGVDAEHRAQYGLPESDENTWRFGLKRLLLGFFVADNGERLWDDSVPFDDVAPGDAQLLGSLCELCECLFSLRERLVKAGPKGLSLNEWSEFLSTALNGLARESQEGHWDFAVVRDALVAMAETRERVNEERSDNDELRLGLRAMLHLLKQELDNSRPSTDFLAGGVTFCALLPLRTIPFRRVCVLGMNQGEFPRNDHHHQLDLSADVHKPGDRSLRADDRYLFLEVLLAAREKLALSYVGRSIQDNSSKPASVVISELCDAVAELPGGNQLPLQRVHPLQPFSLEYFRASHEEQGSCSNLQRSFDTIAYQGALALQSEKKPVPPLFSTLPMSAEPGSQDCAISELIRFWKEPSAAYLQACGVRLHADWNEVLDREPIEVDYLERYQVGDRLLQRITHHEPLLEDIELRRGRLPVGQGGKQLLSSVTRQAELIAEQSRRFQLDPSASSSFIDLRLTGGSSRQVRDVFEFDSQRTQLLVDAEKAKLLQLELTLSGSVSEIYGGVKLEQSFGKDKFARRMTLWIEHLALCAQDKAPRMSVLVSRAAPKAQQDVALYCLAPLTPEAARALLLDLCWLYRIGLSLPLPFFPSASELFVEKYSQPPKGVPAECVAAIAFEHAEAQMKKSDNFERAVIEELYRSHNPLSPPGCESLEVEALPFVRLTRLVLEPMLKVAAEGEQLLLAMFAEEQSA